MTIGLRKIPLVEPKGLGNEHSFVIESINNARNRPKPPWDLKVSRPEQVSELAAWGMKHASKEELADAFAELFISLRESMDELIWCYRVSQEDLKSFADLNRKFVSQLRKSADFHVNAEKAKLEMSVSIALKAISESKARQRALKQEWGAKGGKTKSARAPKLPEGTSLLRVNLAIEKWTREHPTFHGLKKHLQENHHLTRAEAQNAVAKKLASHKR